MLPFCFSTMGNSLGIKLAMLENTQKRMKACVRELYCVSIRVGHV